MYYMLPITTGDASAAVSRYLSPDVAPESAPVAFVEVGTCLRGARRAARRHLEDRLYRLSAVAVFDGEAVGEIRRAAERPRRRSLVADWFSAAAVLVSCADRGRIRVEYPLRDRERIAAKRLRYDIAHDPGYAMASIPGWWAVSAPRRPVPGVVRETVLTGPLASERLARAHRIADGFVREEPWFGAGCEIRSAYGPGVQVRNPITGEMSRP